MNAPSLTVGVVHPRICFPLLQVLSFLLSHGITDVLANFFGGSYLEILKCLIWDEGGLRLSNGKTVK